MCTTCCSIRLFIFPVLCVLGMIILKLYWDGFQSSCIWSIPTTRLCLTSRQVSCVCVFACVLGGGAIMAIRYRLLRPGQSTRVVGTLSELPDKHLVRVRMITKQTSHGDIDSFLLGPLFTAQWLAHLPYTPVMETRLHVACSKLSIRPAVVSMVT